MWNLHVGKRSLLPERCVDGWMEWCFSSVLIPSLRRHWLPLCFSPHSEHRDSSEKKHKDREKERGKHREDSSERHKEKKREEKVCSHSPFSLPFLFYSPSGQTELRLRSGVVLQRYL